MVVRSGRAYNGDCAGDVAENPKSNRTSGHGRLVDDSSLFVLPEVEEGVLFVNHRV